MLYSRAAEGTPNPSAAGRGQGASRVWPNNMEFSSQVVGPTPVQTARSQHKPPIFDTTLKEQLREATELMRHVEILQTCLDQCRDARPDPESTNHQLQDLKHLIAHLEGQLDQPVPPKATSREPLRPHMTLVALTSLTTPGAKTPKVHPRQTHSRTGKAATVTPKSPSDSEDYLAQIPIPSIK
jgi:hypothetical protein